MQNNSEIIDIITIKTIALIAAICQSKSPRAVHSIIDSAEYMYDFQKNAAARIKAVSVKHMTV